MQLSDIAVLILVFAVAVFGFTKGAKRSVKAFFKFFVAVVASFALTKTVTSVLLNLDFVARYIVGNNSLFSLFAIFLPEELNLISTASIKAQVDGVLVSKEAIQNVKVLFLSKGVSGFFMDFGFNMFSLALINPAYLNSALPSATDIIALEMAYSLFCVIVFIILFCLFRAVISLFALPFKNKKKEGKKSFTSRMGGFFVSAIKGFCYSFLIICVITIMGSFSFMNVVTQNINGSTLTKALSSTSSFIISNTIQTDSTDPRYQRMVEFSGYALKN